MKPDFALSLSSEGLSLLQRSGWDWILLGQVYLADADFDARMDTLRKEALERSRDANQVKLVIPNDQIKYYSISRPKDAQPEDIEKMIQLSLEAETPYTLSEISFDWVSNSETIFVAAVARQTLREAEEFSLLQGFQPLGNVAIAPEGHFIGEVFFGRADGSQPSMECDSHPIRVVSSALQAMQMFPGEEGEASDDALEREGKSLETASSDFQSVEDTSEPTTRKSEKRSVTFETLIAPMTANSARSEKRSTAVFEKTALIEQILDKVFKISLRLGVRNKADNKLMFAGYLPALAFILVIVGLIGGVGFYLSRPAVTSDPVENLAYENSPEFQSDTQLLRQDSTLGGLAQIDASTPLTSPEISKAKETQLRQLTRPILSVENYARPGKDIIGRVATAQPKRNLNGAASVEKDDRQNSVQSLVAVARPTTSEFPNTLSKPDKPFPFQFLTDRLHNIYAVSGVWSISPRTPNSSAVILQRLPKVGLWETAVQRPPVTQLEEFEVYETALLVEQVAPEKRNVEVTAFTSGLPPQNEDNFQPNENTSRQATNALTSPMPNGNDLANSKPLIASLGLGNERLETPIQGVGLTAPVLDNIRVTTRSFDELPTPQAFISQDPNILDEAASETLPSNSIASLGAFSETAPKNATNTVEFAALTPPNLPASLLPQQTPVLLPTTPASLPDQDDAAVPLIELRPLPKPESEENATENLPRPKPRPEEIKPIEPETFSGAVSDSLRPKARPKTKKPSVSSVEVASIVAILPEEEGDEASAGENSSETTNTSIPGKKATIKRAINLREVNLLGVYYFGGKRSALVRLKNGKRLMVKVGDSLDGGKVAAIGKRELRYVKSGKNITLGLPG